jgi:sodium/proline symporter
MLAYVSAQMNAAGKAFEATFDLSYVWGVILGALIILTYTVTGGFRAICWTDIVQALFMVIALIGMPLILLARLGGFGEFMTAARQIDPELLSWNYGKVGFAMLGFVVGLLGIGLGYPGQPHVLSRFMAAKDKATVKTGSKIALVWMILAYLGAVSFGLFARIFYHAGGLADPEKAMPTAVTDLLPPILGGFVVAAIISAICSTADSQLLVVSSTISRDIVPIFRKAGKAADAVSELRFAWWMDRIVLVAIGLIAVLLAAMKSQVIFQSVLYAWSALGASFGPVVILGLLWKKANKAGAIAGMLTGLVVTVVWRNLPALKSFTDEWTPAFILAFIAVVIVSLATQKKGALVS